MKLTNEISKAKSRDFGIFVKACIGIILIGILALSLNQIGIGINLVLSGVFMIVFAMLLGKEHYFQDERSRRIAEKAGYHAYGATLITILLILAFGKVIPAIENADYWNVSMIVFFAGFIPFLIYDWYYKRKGDVK
ncbi:MAG: DUF2178 domain-containing protein [Candidatus Methanoperedens sp.]|nr:DUF2178 domain-containing protein [Candidatus Methanoperedens sp.]MCZ7371518.1 DUF2178 domain-containing protein [Candidatus Methanoperedens sp.]